uniref:phenylalanine--tRNA ligase n=1 Tax=Antithamnionella ternifolia TaxID=207919 RepID=A0A4D6WK45_9FLOR|nr:Phenylalanine-tRNA ligase beta subunit [Antithamnionella ternifolia]
MKFSWQSLNHFIDLKNIDFNNLINKLPLIGFEVENIENTIIKGDKIIELSVTANRQDMLSIIGLARELSCILQQRLKKYITYSQYNSTKVMYSEILNLDNIKTLTSIRVNIIKNIQITRSPSWLQKTLSNCDICLSHLLDDIQNFIQLKWGQKILIFNISNINENKNYIKIHNQYLQYNNINLVNLSQNIDQVNNIYTNSTNIVTISSLLICNYSRKNDNNNNEDSINAYNETLYLIASLAKGSIGQTYYYSQTKIINKKNLNINKLFIQKTLGPIKQKSKYISKQNIYKILYQLNFYPNYNKYTKNFAVTIPTYRKQDLSRTIDIVEEIGRLYGYEKFLDQLPKHETKGNISKQYILIKNIRKYFRSIGLHEVINSSLNNNYQNLNKYLNTEKDSVYLYNPLSEDQLTLRENLIRSIFINKTYNTKHKNDNTEIFEIGRTFDKNIHTDKLNENILLTGILNNNNFIKKSWKDKTSELTWFHAKGILEELFEKIQIKIEWETINQTNVYYLDNIHHNYFNIDKTTLIRHTQTQDIIGIMGQLNSKLCKNFIEKNNIYMFEIKINILLKNQIVQNHLKYNFSTYSIYPKVSRDISIKINKEQTIKQIKNLIYQTKPNLIENITIFNEYNSVIDNKRNIGIRITYRSLNKTIDSNEIKNIDLSLSKFIKLYQ